MLASPASFNGVNTAALPPLPAPWSEHVAPTGHLYYYNPKTLESTYMRPISLSSLLPPDLNAAPVKRTKKKKEKPAKKTAISNSPWIRVLTNRGNVFFHNSDTKESTWVMPLEIQEVVEAMDFKDEDEDTEMHKNEEESTLLDKGRQATADDAAESPLGGKRKLREEEEAVNDRESKRQKVADEDEEEDEEWQKEMAEVMAREEAIKKQEEDEFGRDKAQAIPAEEAKEMFQTLLSESNINPMHPWEKSLAIFSSDLRYRVINVSLSPNTLLDIFEEFCRDRLKEQRASQNATSSSTQNPLDAYKALLKETVTSTRTTYTQFRQQVKKERRFYSYGRDEKEREKVFRSYLKELGDKKKEERKKAEEAFLVMIKEGEKKGTLSRHEGKLPKWSDAKKHFQKDPRYDEVGSSSLREELYETFAKMQSQDDATPSTTVDTADPRTSNSGATTTEDERKRRREKAVKEREERVRLEKEKVEQANAKSRVGLTQAETELTFKSLLIDTIRDPTVSFSAAMNYLSADPRFTSITQSTQVPQHRLQYLFQEHISHLLSKGSTALSSLFESYAPGLDKRWDDLSPKVKDSIGSSPVVKRLGLDTKVSLGRGRRSSARHGKSSGSDTEEEEKERFEYPALRQEFERWQRQRFTDARAAFDAMLAENAFVEFWGRVGKMGLTDDEEKKRLGRVVFAGEGGDLVDDVSMEIDDIGGGEEGGGGKADLQKLAKGIDVKEMERVLKSDKRFTVFNYMPQEREQWLQDYVRNLTAPKASVHIN